jgi:hypothetical protein
MQLLFVGYASIKFEEKAVCASLLKCRRETEKTRCVDNVSSGVV